MKRLWLTTLLVATVALSGACRQSSQPATPTPRPQPLVPTLDGRGGSTSQTNPSPVSLPPVPPVGRERFGVGVATRPLTDYASEGLGIGWTLDWGVQVDPPRPGGVDFWQLVSVSEEGHYPDVKTIQAAAQANPGSVWLIGNEPDVIWQDNTTPERYAERYHELYQLLKAADPTCQIAIGGVAQPTPLRLAYLDRVFSAYQAQYGEPMPVEIWNVHNFLLREERGSWGVEIPPGFGEDEGILYEIEDHDDVEAFKAQILTFRRWMAERGQRDRPLVVSEYGILMTPEHGFDQPRVQAFMYATFDFFLTARDEALGYPKDENRLVQWWAWFSLDDTVYPTGNLFDPETRAVTPLGVAFARYVPPGGRGR